MRMNEIDFEGAPPIDGYGPGFFRVAERVVEGSVIVAGDGFTPWGGTGDVDALIALAGTVDVILMGLGGDVAHPPAALIEAVEAAGLGIEPMSTPSACRTYNVLLSEGRRIAAALLPVEK